MILYLFVTCDTHLSANCLVVFQPSGLFHTAELQQHTVIFGLTPSIVFIFIYIYYHWSCISKSILNNLLVLKFHVR